MSRSILFVVAGLVWLGTMPLAAQDAVLGQLYGNGVHAYFSQDYVKAYQNLTSAIDGHTQDPRAFYFRGLTLLKLGRPQEAESDFQRGAKLESAIDPSRIYNVARALERIQGSDRVALEQYRLEARMTVLKKAEEERRARYDENVKEQRRFLQQQSEMAPAKSVEPAGDSTKPPEAIEPGKSLDPFDTGRSLEPKKEDAGSSVQKPGPAAKAGVEPEPFGPSTPDITTPAAPAKKPAATPPADNPFGDATEPKPAAPAATAPKKPAAAQPADASPFGNVPEAKPAAPTKKTGAAKPSSDDDPFGAGDAAPKPPAPADAAEKPDAAKAAPAATKPDDTDSKDPFSEK